MNEAAERVRAGEERAGKPCGFCKEPLDAEDQAAVCAECVSLHHEACWDRELGCCKAVCINAPLKRLDAGAPPKERRARKKPAARECVGCSATLPKHVEVCDDCYAINTPDGLYHGPKTTVRGAKEALVIALVGLFLCGPLLGAVAIGRANKAREAIRVDPRLGGEGLAMAGLVLGILDIAVWVITLMARAGGVR